MPGSPSVILQTSPYSPGDEIAGKYRLKRLLGEGGMGAVWEARNTALEIDVAVKLIRADLNRETFGQRLRQEAKAAAKLGHAAIVRVFDVGETERGDPFIVMELLEGCSLGDLINDAGRVDPRRAVQLLLPIVDALVVAHSKGIVHRDLKPDNVFISREQAGEQPKLLDFGIVKLEPAAGESHLTQVGTVLGSPDYMSPEQARGDDDVDHRVDIWSFSVMLYEAVTGQLPFVASNYNALLRSIVENEPKPIAEHGVHDPVLWEILFAGLQKERDRRFQSMTELGRVLAAWLQGQNVFEDACGASLETRWLSRTTDPQGRPISSPRATLASFSSLPSRSPSRPSFANEPVSQRAVVRSLSFAATVEQHVKPRRWILLAAGAVVLGLAVTLVALFGHRESGPAAAPLVSAAEVAPTPAPVASAAIAQPSSVTPEVAVVASEKPQKPASASKAPKRATPAPKSKGPTPKSGSDSDLISPY